MVADFVTLLGLIAGSLTTIAYLPQVLKIWKTKSARDISLPTFTTLTIGLLLWLIYGLLISSIPIIMANAVTLILSAAILVCKVKYG